MILAMQPPSLRVDTARLGECERLFLWCIRSWVHAAFRRTSSEDLRLALLAHRLESAVEDIDGLMRQIAAHASGTVDIRIRRATELSGDEIHLLRALRAGFLGLPELGDALLAPLVHQPGRSAAMQRLWMLAESFRSAGLDACEWPQPEGRPDRTGSEHARRHRAPGNDVA